MKNSTFSRIVFIALMLLMGWETYAQNYVPFTPKFNETLKGDIRLIGNNILGPDKIKPYHKTDLTNDKVNMVYVDIDNDPTTLNSSSADLEIPNDGCYKIVHAGLYWGAVNRGKESLTDVKFKGPEGPYHDIKGTVIYDANTNVTGNSLPYACYADVTSIVAGLGTNLGTYTVGNVSTGTGKTADYKPSNGTGHSAGWSLFIVFEDPTLPGKYITSFDGFSSINKDVAALDIPISGFQTPPAPIPVTAKFAFAALEGDQPIKGDKLRINGTLMSTPERPGDNFFNSTVTKLGGGLVTNRNPNSTNTLGFDTGIMEVPNPNKNVIGNGDTSATIRMESSQDQYFAYFIAFAVDVIQPKIVLTKIVEDEAGNEIGGAVVDLGQKLTYVIGFQNTGNDDAQDMVIRDVLPINVNFNYPSGLTLPSSVSTHSYNPLTRELVFTIKKDYIKKNTSPLSEIKIQVQVVESCNELNDMCSNIIQNQAFTTYWGVQNPNFKSTDDPSVNTNTGCLLIPQATNFLADLKDCIFTENVTLCQESVQLTAGDGYNSYSWSTSPTGMPVIGKTQSISVSKSGTYYVHNTANAPCQSIDQIFEVTNFVGATLINPVIAFADISPECKDDGEKLPKIFLCGANASRLIDTKITDASSIIWEKLVEGSCTGSWSDDCANKSDTCSWTKVGEGTTFNADQAGQFRLTLNYKGGCSTQYYFNVYQNMLSPTATSNDIICNTPGKIAVGGVPNGYEYSIDGTNYQSSNEFEVSIAGSYTAYVRQIGNITNPCVFTVPDIQIRKREFTVISTINQPLCYGDKGSINIEARDVRAQYQFTLSQNGTLVNTSGFFDENFYTFSNLNTGTYTIAVNTDDGCIYTEDVKIIEPSKLTATSALTIPLTCTDGEITIYPDGGTPPYFYFVNSTTEFQEDPQIIFTTPGVYNVLVVDSNDCETNTSITVKASSQPDYTIISSDVLCYNSNTGEIRFNVTNANGYTIAYSIDNGVTYSSNPIFSNLAANTYPTLMKYAIGGAACFSETDFVTITQADTALTASAGVSELAGCGPSGDEGKGKVRITNPQGGTAPYQYSFDNQGSWITSNEAYVAPGTYTLYIKDANGCIYPMPGIILEKEPVAPMIDVASPDFNCDGTATATVSVKNQETASFSYTYLLNGVENTNSADPKTFLNVPNGNHTISVRYTLETVPTYSNLLYETFGYGEDTTSPGINTQYYCFERQVEATKCNGNIAINDGDYSVTAHIVSPFRTWLQPGDHTPQTVPPTPKGRSLVVNIGDQIPVTAILYQKEINDIIPNQPIIVDFYAINLIKSQHNIYDPNLLVALVDASGKEISSFATGDIPKSEKWENFVTTLNPGNNTSLKFILRSKVQQVDGNDVAIDDIRVYQLPKICVTQVNFPFNVETEKAFTSQILNATDATCFGAKDGTITISAQNFNLIKGFQYSLDGVTWKTQMTSPVTIKDLAAGDYNIQVRYDNSDATCSVALNQLIKTPSLLKVTATATPATCLTGGTINAKATGGSSAYSYELLDTASLTLIKNFPSNGILNNVPAGDYTIKATDVNGCTATTTVSLVDSILPTATIAVSSYCYDSVNGVTLEVTAADGKAPFNYSINGGPFSTKNKFTGLTPGIYTVKVRDANGCEVTLGTETIAPQLAINTKLTKDLDCTTSPDAVITGTISGGYAPYTYEMSINGGAFSGSQTASTPFTYIATTDGKYQFKITDAQGCTTGSDVITVATKSYPTATTKVVNVTCNGNSNGSFQISPSKGVGPYTYSFEGSGFTSKSNYNGLKAGTYTYQVKDAKDCIFDGSVTIKEPTALVASAAATKFTCSVDNTAQSALVTIEKPTTGTAPYTYSFNGSAYTSINKLTVYDNGTVQTITYSVKDANECPVGGSVTILPLNPPTALNFSATAVTCLEKESKVTITTTNGVGVLTYEIISPATAIGNTTGKTTGIFSGLLPDTYVFKVTDANGCFYTESLPITPVTNIAVTGVKLSDVLCYGDNEGAAQFTVSGYATAYTYALISGTGTLTQSVDKINLTGLVAGSYTIEVKDTVTGCTATETLVISQPTNALDLTATATHVHCHNYESQISVNATGGTLNYTYVAVQSGTPAPSASDYKSGNTILVNTNSGANLNWDVYVKDANGCINKTSVPVILDALPSVTVPKVDNQCTASSGFTFTAVGTGVAPLQYSINGGASYQDSPTFTVNAAGNYTITVKDGNGCTANTSTAAQVFEPISVRANLTKDLTCSMPEAAAIEITASGGNAPYSYEVSSDGGGNYTSIAGPIYTTSNVGTYQFRVTDANGCNKVTNSVTTNAIVPVTVSVTSVDPTCNGNSDGSIRLNALTGEPTFTYSIDGGSTFVSTNVFGGLVAGSYNYVVRDSKGCEILGTINLEDPLPLDVSIVRNPIQCNSNVPGSIDVTINSGGIAPFTYTLYDNRYTQVGSSVTTASTTHTFLGLSFGDYYVTIVDAKGCEFKSVKLRIETPPNITFTGLASTGTCATGATVDIEVITGAADYTYSIYGQLATSFGPTSSTTHTFTGLDHGVTYQFQVIDAGGCFSIIDVTTPIISGIDIDNITTSNVNCNGDNGGAIDFIVLNYDSSVTSLYYEVRDELTNLPITPAQNGTFTGLTGSPVNGTVNGLSAGNYTLFIRETNGTLCTVSSTFQISQPIQTLLSVITDEINANCNSDALITIKTTGGTGPYQYAAGALGFTPVSGDFGSSNVLNLDPSIRTNWDIVVKDANGCLFTINEIIDSDAEPTIEPVNPVCFDGTAFNITLDGTTFNGIKTYSIGGAFQSSPDFTITAAGSYTISIKDANNCIATEKFTVAPPLLLDAVLDLDLTCTVDGSISLTATGGTGTYNTYEVSDDNGATYTALAGTTFTALIEGTYIFKVTDSQGCEAVSNDIIVTPKTTPTLTHTQVNVSCNGGDDGSIVVTAANGIAPYQYSINGGAFQTSNLFKGLAAGTYSIVARDSKNCDSAATLVTITEPDPLTGTGDLTQRLTCGTGNATQPAIVTITGSGGTAPYTYSFDSINYTSTNTYKTLVAGTVTAYVKDANGCAVSAPITVTIPALSVPTDLDFTATDVTCIATESEVTLKATGGIGTLTYEIISPTSASANTSGATTGIFTGLVPDIYTFTVTDENGCHYTESYTVIPVTNITVSGVLVADVSCLGGNDGAVTFEVAKFSGTYSFQINSGAKVSGQTGSAIPLSGLPAGDQTIVVTDEITGCTDTYTITVSEPTAVALTILENINANCNFGAQVTVEASGGTASYQYAFVIGGSAAVLSDYTTSNTAVLDPATSTNWTVWVMDSNGCGDTKIDVVITTDPLPTMVVPTFAINQCTVATGFEFTVTNPTGIAPFTYSIGNGFQSSPTFTVAEAGSYTVTIMDANGCTNATPMSIEIYPALALTPTITVVTTCATNDGEITVTAVGGSGTYTYSISPSPAGFILVDNVFTRVPSGSYTITIKDTVTDCTETATITLDAATPVDFTLTSTDVTCKGGGDGTITVDLVPGKDDNPIYTYEITAGPTTRPAQNSNVFAGLKAGTYTVQVNSGRGCSEIKTIEVEEADQIVVSAPVVVEYACTVGTNATNFASISINPVTGGSGTYTKYEFIKEGTVVQSGSKNVYTETDLAGGLYTINVYDNNACVGTTTATIKPFIRLDALTVAIETAITCTNDETIKVSVSSTGGIPTSLEYTLEDFAGVVPTQVNATGTFTGLSIGNYKITVTNKETGCSLQTVHYVNNPNTFDLSVDTVVDVTCFSGSDGSVNVTFIDRFPTPTNKAGSFSYTVVNALGVQVANGTTPNAGPISITGLASGTYTISASLTNSPFCAVDKNFTITAPSAALTISETHTEITCVSGNNDGSIFATAKGGWPGGYEFELSGATITTIPYSTSGYFKNLSAGIYTISVKDSRGCIATKTVELTNPLPITVTASADINMLTCFGDKNATITVDLPTGGQGSNYSYTLNMISPVASSSGPQASPVFSGLGAGTYTITVTDGYSCSATSVNIDIEQPTPVVASLIVATTPTCLTNATLTLSAAGGTGSYIYSKTSTFATIEGAFTSPITFAVTPGTYKYYVRDTNGCVAVVTNDIKIDAVPELQINLDLTNASINCAGDDTGVIVATAQGGLGNYVYTLQDAQGKAIPAVQNRPGVFTELFAGIYYVKVDSGNCHDISEKIEITEPVAPLNVDYSKIDVSCYGANNGSIEIIATGGSGAIKYAISPQLNQFFDSNVFENLAPGTYDIIVQDTLGCYEHLNITITEPAAPVSIIPSLILSEVCQGDNDAMFSISVSGGIAPYDVSLVGYDGPYTTGTGSQFDFTGLKGGDHAVFVRDSNGCESEWNITVPESVKIEPVAVVDYLCDDNSPGNRVTITVDASITDLSDLDYSLDGGKTYQASNVFNDLVTGTGYSIQVRHSDGCIQETALFDIVHVNPLLLDLNDGGLNEIVALAAGGTGDYKFTLNGEDYGSTSSFIITKSGEYTVTVTDSSGCVAMATRHFEFIDLCIPNYFTPNGDNNQDTWAPGCAINYPNMEFKIFDRYGREVGNYRLGQAWDGRYKERELPTGDYWYIIKLNNSKDNRDFVGHFTLYR